MKKISILIFTLLLLGVLVTAAIAQDEGDEYGQYLPLILNNTSSKTEIRWFVGLGAGTEESMHEPQKAVVDGFNATHDDIELVLEIVDNEVAYDTLATQIAAGNPPDIVGPVGVRGRDTFYGAWLDLQPLINSTSYDLSDFDPALVDFYNIEGQGQIGIPFASYPSFVIYNKDLFDEAGAAYPPATYGEPYVWADSTVAEWNMDTLHDLAMFMTVDASGNDATMEEFDPEKIVQFGWMNQWTDPRGVGTFFGPGSFLADDGVTAQIPEEWQAAWKWTYDGWWNDWFIPNGPYSGADFLQSGGGSFGSGNLAMTHIHSWYVAPWALDGSFAFDFAATPSYEGTVTSKMHADSFFIHKDSDNPEEAFEVLSYLLSPEIAPELLAIYGAQPARNSLQEGYIKDYSENNFPGMELNWDVALASAAYADNPNHESWMPSFLETTDRYNEFWIYLTNTPGVDVDAEIETLREDLQAIFNAYFEAQ